MAKRIRLRELSLVFWVFYQEFRIYGSYSYFEIFRNKTHHHLAVEARSITLHDWLIAWLKTPSFLLFFFLFKAPFLFPSENNPLKILLIEHESVLLIHSFKNIIFLNNSTKGISLALCWSNFGNFSWTFLLQQISTFKSLSRILIIIITQFVFFLTSLNPIRIAYCFDFNNFSCYPIVQRFSVSNSLITHSIFLFSHNFRFVMKKPSLTLKNFNILISVVLRKPDLIDSHVHHIYQNYRLSHDRFEMMHLTWNVKHIR